MVNDEFGICGRERKMKKQVVKTFSRVLSRNHHSEKSSFALSNKALNNFSVEITPKLGGMQTSEYHHDIIHEALQHSESNHHHHSVHYATTALGKKTKLTTIFYNRTREEWLKLFSERQNYGIISHMGFKIVDVPKEGELIAELTASINHMAPNQYMHAASIVFLAGKLIHILSNNFDKYIIDNHCLEFHSSRHILQM